MMVTEQLKLPVGHTREDLCRQLCKRLGIKDTGKCPEFEIIKRSLDARKKPDIFFVYSIRITEPGFKIPKKADKRYVKCVEDEFYDFLGEVGLRKLSSEQKTNPELVEGNRKGDRIFRRVRFDRLSEEGVRHSEGGRSRVCPGNSSEAERPVVVGFGPAGMFCALMLARAGLKPIVLERGKPADDRIKDVESFFAGGELNENSNVQFGEGGAGTFSDGKLNTGTGKQGGRAREVLVTFVRHGAPEEILYDNKPHIGTDILVNVIKGIREEILRLGGEILFNARFEELVLDKEGCVRGCIYSKTDTDNNDGYRKRGEENLDGINTATVFQGCLDEKNREGSVYGNKGFRDHPGKQEPVFTEKQHGVRQEIRTRAVCLAIGHSSRDTFEALYRKNVPMEQKAFAVGVRIEHPQELIDRFVYGEEHRELKKRFGLPAGDYKLTGHTRDGRGVYSFCMCPGGFVVNSSSERGMTAVNGMSFHARDGANANSALVVTVTGEDFNRSSSGDSVAAGSFLGRDVNDGTDQMLHDHVEGGNAYREVLAGLEFQRQLEKAAYREGAGKVPVQLLGDFEENRVSTVTGGVVPCIKGEWVFGNLRKVLPEFISRSILECMEHFDKKIPGFAMPDACLSGVESRTSSPVRIIRDETGMSRIRGLFPCGEGAGYAGGIMSAAVDGIKCAERIAGLLG